MRGEEKRLICEALQEIEFALLDELRRSFEEGTINEFWEAIPQILQFVELKEKVCL